MYGIFAVLIAFCCCSNVYSNSQADTNMLPALDSLYTRIETLLTIRTEQLKKQLQTALFRQMPLEHIQDIIDQGAPLNEPLYKKTRPLAYAVANSNSAIIALLIQNGARVNTRHTSTNPLLVAVHYGYAPEVELLLRNGAHVTKQHLKHALARKQHAIFAVLKRRAHVRKLCARKTLSKLR